MKKILKTLKNELILQYTDEALIYDRFMDKVFDMYENEWDISEAFSFYNSDLRIQINKNKQERKRVNSSQLHIATQFFTPKWLVEYIVDNSLGRFFPETQTRFRDGNPVYKEKKNNLKILDPAVGTGNMFLYSYDLMEKAYREQGVPHKQIPKKILSSFYGLDIDKRAALVAKRLLLKKAGLKSFDFNIFSVDDVSSDLLKKAKQENLNKVHSLLSTIKNSREIGSILKGCENAGNEIATLKNSVKEKKDIDILRVLELLTNKYDVILVNPPYLSSSDYSQSLKNYIYKHYPQNKHDLFSVFISRCFELLDTDGLLGVVCPYNWMFIKSFTCLRENIVKNKGLYNLLQLSAGGYNKAVVYLSAFVAGNQKSQNSYFIRLTEFGAKQQKEKALNAVNRSVPYRYIKNQDIFNITPQYSLIYWTGREFIQNFSYPKLNRYLEIRQGMATGNNKEFLRKINEVNIKEIAFDANNIEQFDNSGKKYALYNKGGKFRKWYGNINYVIKFDKVSREILSQKGNKMPSREYYFKECITWTLVSSKGHFGARYSSNSVFDVGGSCAFVKEGSKVNVYVFLGFLCSKVATYYLNALNPTLNVQVGDIKNLPFIEPDSEQCQEIERLVKENIVISKNDWYNNGSIDDFSILKRNEEKLNKIFIKLYSLEKEIDYTVKDSLITLKRYMEIK